jgi:hypothetical protein
MRGSLQVVFAGSRQALTYRPVRIRITIHRKHLRSVFANQRFKRRNGQFRQVSIRKQGDRRFADIHDVPIAAVPTDAAATEAMTECDQSLYAFLLECGVAETTMTIHQV